MEAKNKSRTVADASDLVRDDNDNPRSTNGSVALPTRSAEVQRKTRETAVAVALRLDGSGRGEINTGVPFLDHMLDSFARHGFFDVRITATGDLHIDDHHTVEDVGIVLGGTLREALADKRGVRRFANALVPLDEALVQVALDLSGRPYLVYEVDPVAEWIGTFDPQLAEEFWRAFVTAAAMTMHVRLVTGKNTPHIVEASFKATARCLRDAVRLEGVGVPSTKGTLGNADGV